MEYRNNGSLPQKTDRISPFGPVEMPDTEPEISTVTIEDVYKLAREADNYISSKNSLPTFLKVGNFQIGTGSLYALFSAVYLNMNSNNPAGEYSISSFDSYPKTYRALRAIHSNQTCPLDHRRSSNSPPFFKEGAPPGKRRGPLQEKGGVRCSSSRKIGQILKLISPHFRW